MDNENNIDELCLSLLSDRDSLKRFILDDYALRGKCNAQIDIINYIIEELIGIDEMRELNIEKLDKSSIVYIINHLKQVISDKNNLINNQKIILDTEARSPAASCQYFDIYFVVMSNIIRDDAFYIPKKKTKNTYQYNVIEYNLFMEYILHFAGQMDSKRLLEKWKEMGLIASNESEKIAFTYTYSGNSVKAIRFNKSIIDTIKECMIT